MPTRRSKENSPSDPKPPSTIAPKASSSSPRTSSFCLPLVFACTSGSPHQHEGLLSECTSSLRGTQPAPHFSSVFAGAIRVPPAAAWLPPCNSNFAGIIPQAQEERNCEG